MKNLCHTLRLGLAVLAALMSAGAVLAATCTGADNCRACKNCKYCRHCAKLGGTCGVCKRLQRLRTSSLVSVAPLPARYCDSAEGEPVQDRTRTSDVRSDELFQRATEVASRARSLKARISLSLVGPSEDPYRRPSIVRFYFTAEVQLRRSGFMRAKVPAGAPTTLPIFTTVADGRSLYVVNSKTQSYAKLPFPGQGKSLTWPPGADYDFDLLPAFFNPTVINALCPDGRRRYVGTRKRQGRSYDVVRFDPFGMTEEQEFYFFGSEGCLDGIEMHDQQHQMYDIRWWVRNLELDASMAPGTFRFAPPAGFRLISSNSGNGLPALFSPNARMQATSRGQRHR